MRRIGTSAAVVTPHIGARVVWHVNADRLDVLSMYTVNNSKN